MVESKVMQFRASKRVESFLDTLRDGQKSRIINEILEDHLAMKRDPIKAIKQLKREIAECVEHINLKNQLIDEVMRECHLDQSDIEHLTQEAAREYNYASMMKKSMEKLGVVA